MHDKFNVDGEAAVSCLASLEAFYKQIAEMRDAEALDHAQCVLRGAAEADETGDHRVDRVGRDLQVLQRFLGRVIGQVDDEESCRVRNYIARAVRKSVLPNLHGAHPERYLSFRIHNPGPCVGVDFGVLCLTPSLKWAKATTICIGRGPFDGVDAKTALRISSCVDDPDPESLDILADHQHPDLARLIKSLKIASSSSVTLKFGGFVTEMDSTAWNHFFGKTAVYETEHFWHGKYDKHQSNPKFQEHPSFDDLQDPKSTAAAADTLVLWRKPFSCMARISKHADNLSIVHPRYYAKLAMLAARVLTDKSGNSSSSQDKPHAGLQAVANLIDHWRRCELEPAYHRALIMQHDGNAALAAHTSLRDSKTDTTTYNDLKDKLSTWKVDMRELCELTLKIHHASDAAKLDGLVKAARACDRAMRDALSLGHRLAVRGHEAYVASVGAKEVPEQADFLSSKFMQLACRRQAALDVLVNENQRLPFQSKANEDKRTYLSVVIGQKTDNCLLIDHEDGQYTLRGGSLDAAVAVANHYRAYLRILVNNDNVKTFLSKLRTIAQEAYCELLGVVLACPQNDYGRSVGMLDTLAPYPIAVAVMRQNSGLTTDQPVVYWSSDLVLTSSEWQSKIAKTIVVDKTAFPVIVY